MIDLSKIKTYPLKERKNKAGIRDFVKLCGKPEDYEKLMGIFPDILAVSNIKSCVEAIRKSRENGKPFVLMMGAHSIKCGLSPLIIEMMEKGIITHFATNGASAIHDFEIAYMGETSEDVAIALEDGTFGMAYETAHYLNDAYIKGAAQNKGMGGSVSDLIDEMNLPYRDYSIFYRAAKAGVKATIHTAIGTDIIHQHPGCSGEALGKVSHIDFHRFADTLSELDGGTVMNLGSAVLLPEVFLKALTIVRNLGYNTKNFTAVNIDMVDHYRPRVNVLNRPTSGGGKKLFLQGPIELFLPLIVHGLFAKMGLEFGQWK
ncbi:MAG: hypothetical protein LWY06_15790 [Firmicutes bacterium]|nr:hypothetical protein [Bacillota bacterium]